MSFAYQRGSISVSAWIPCVKRELHRQPRSTGSAAGGAIILKWSLIVWSRAHLHNVTSSYLSLPLSSRGSESPAIKHSWRNHHNCGYFPSDVVVSSMTKHNLLEEFLSFYLLLYGSTHYIYVGNSSFMFLTLARTRK